MCGESIHFFRCKRHTVGSPPHVWGKRISSEVPYVDIGITPTCVGKAGLSGLGVVSGKDHPHMCGESSAE